MKPEERDAVHDHLYMHPPAQGIQRKSNFMGALIDTRRIANRDLETGRLRKDATSSGGWMAAIGYLVLLDQIGTCFGAVGCTHGNKGPSFLHALECFTDLDRKEGEALYAVRNALAHDYSLFNVNPKDPGRTHVFTYKDDECDPLVRLPQTPWTGDYGVSTPPDQVTIINLRAVGDLVEEIVQRL